MTLIRIGNYMLYTMKKLTQKDKEEIKFWRKAQRIIKKGYNLDCKGYEKDCIGCQAKKTLQWIENHIVLIHT